MRIIHLTALDNPDIKPAVRQLADAVEPCAARKGQMLLDLVCHLEARGSDRTAFGYVSGDELWLSSTDQPTGARVHVRADWQDFGPVRDGLPEMHYRLSIRRPGSSLSRDERACEPSDVERLIWEAFGWASRETQR